MFFLSSADFFQNQCFRKILSGTPSESQTVRIQIRLDILTGLIWVQAVCKSYQKTTLEAKTTEDDTICRMIFSELRSVAE